MCGENARKVQNRCECISNYIGDPNRKCYPICIINSDCPSTKACRNNDCVDPCSKNICAENAICEVYNHNAICSCPFGYIGDPLILCKKRNGMSIRKH